MGIGNTTPSACLLAAMTGTPAEIVTGRGTGIDDETLALKTRVVADAVARLEPGADPIAVLAEVGGLEHAGLVGRSEEHTSEIQSLMRHSYAVFCLKKNTYICDN